MEAMTLSYMASGKKLPIEQDSQPSGHDEPQGGGHNEPIASIDLTDEACLRIDLSSSD